MVFKDDIARLIALRKKIHTLKNKNTKEIYELAEMKLVETLIRQDVYVRENGEVVVFSALNHRHRQSIETKYNIHNVIVLYPKKENPPCPKTTTQ